MSSRRFSDVICMLRGLKRVADSFAALQRDRTQLYWSNSSLKSVAKSVSEKAEISVSQVVTKSQVSKSPPIECAQKNLDALIPASLKLPPVTEADLEELSREINTHSIAATVDSTEVSPSAPASTENVATPTTRTPQNRPAANATVQNEDFTRKNPAERVTDYKLSSQSRESKVPSSRFARVMSFGSLATGLGMGAVAEAVRRAVASGPGDKAASSPLLSDANMERIVATLCRVRGAALKLGQMLSIQDNSMLSPRVRDAFERVRQSADFMPLYQMNKAMAAELGTDWKARFAEFDDRPFAAASIGQVHKAVLHDGRLVAVKIQYPGVANSIDSDINNLLAILKVWQILPKGMYAENVMDSARKELAFECDYEREAKCMTLFRELLAGDATFSVPAVIPELSTKRVLVADLIPGVPLDKCIDLSQQIRDELGHQLIRLCTTELYEWNIMQTDPNWSNFFYDESTNKVHLLDFGATRQYSRRFVDLYIQVIKAAAVGDTETIVTVSKEMGFLTGYESKAMVDAHIQAVTVLGGPCGSDTLFEFGNQDITKKIENIIPVMLKHRLGPPPEETYSLHRKLAGTFLLCSKLDARINCKVIYDRIFDDYQPGRPDPDYGLPELKLS